MEKDEKPLIFLGKVQKKPLELLKALIAFGGKGVSEGQLSDALWPDADGDLARRSFDTTLHRLRRLLGNDRVIRIQEGSLTLDSECCWVDLWAFERNCDQADGFLRNFSLGNGDSETEETADEAVETAEKAVRMYKGHFLQDDLSQSWALSMRERVRSKFLRLIIGLGEYYGQKREYDKAKELFLRGLEIDDLCEEFYQNLMICYHRLGQQAEAVNIYNRCRKMLLTVLKLTPSSKTEEIYSSLRHKQ